MRVKSVFNIKRAVSLLLSIRQLCKFCFQHTYVIFNKNAITKNLYKKNAECTLTSKIVAVEYPVVTAHPHPQVSQDQHCKSRDYSKVYVVVTSFLQTKLQQNNIDNALSLKVGTLITTVLYIRLFLFMNRKYQRYSVYLPVLVSL